MDPLQIANQALGLLGVPRITSLEDPVKAAREINGIWDGVRDDVLEKGDWAFATERFALARDPIAPAFEYRSRYELPSDVIAVRWCKPAGAEGTLDAFAASMSPLDSDSAAWVKESGKNSAGERRNYVLVDTMASQVHVRGVVRVEDSTLWSPGFCQTLVARLAAELCIPLLAKAGLLKDLWQLYDLKLGEAKGNDAKQGVPHHVFRVSALAQRRR